MSHDAIRKASLPPDLALVLGEKPLRARKEQLRALQSPSAFTRSFGCFDELDLAEMDPDEQSTSSSRESASGSSRSPPSIYPRLQLRPSLSLNPYHPSNAGTPHNPYLTAGPSNPYTQTTGSSGNRHPFSSTSFNPYRGSSQLNPYLSQTPLVPIQPYPTPSATDLNNSSNGSNSNQPSGSSESGLNRKASVQKVPIPRLPAREDAARYRRRHIARACENCRTRKVKCSGETNGCHNCLINNEFCCYTDGKREKVRAQVATLEKAIDTHKRAIQKLGSRLGLSNADIDATLKEASYKPKPGADEPAKQQHYSIVARPPDSTEEECSRDEISLATGFIGTSSEVTWLREVDKVIDEDKGHLGPELPIATWSYFTDTPIFEPYTARLDPNGLPSTPVARRLFNTYFSQVHETFPIIRKSVFERQFAGFFSNTSIYTGKRFRAVLNMVFAIGALFVQLTDNTSGVDQRNHTLYFERARVLDIEGTGFQRSDLQHIQTEGLAALYLLAIGQVNRSRKRCVNAVQGAIDLGLHLRNLGGSADDVKETRYRVWWSIYVLEHHLSVLTGRPSCIHESGYSTPLPIPFDEDQFIQEDAARLLRSSKDRTSQLTGASSTYKPGEKGDAKYQDCDIRYNDPSNAMYFLQVVLLTAIGRRAATALYGPQAANVPWQTTKYMIQNLLADLNSFLLQVPAIYDFTAVAIATDHPSHKISLAILFYSTKVLVTRPCLFRLKMNAGGDGSQGLDDYGEFCKQQATDCINAACNVIRFFPEPPDGEELYGTTPWWCILHLLMQSGAIFLLELSLKCQHAPDMVDTVTLAATRVYRYLMVLSEHETTPRKALKIYRRLRHTLGADAKDDDRDDDDCSTPRNPASLQGSSSASDPLVQPTPRSSAPGLGQSSDNSGASTSDPHTGTSPSAGTSDSNIYAPYLEFMQNTGFLDLLNSDTIPSWGDILGSCTTQGPSSSEESNDSGHSAGPDPMDQTPG